MAQQNYINEYSHAVYGLAVESGKINEFRDHLIELVTAFSSEPKFFNVFASLSVENSIKKEFVNAIFVGQLHPYIINLLFHLIDKNLEKDVIRICEKVINAIDNKTQRVYVKIYTPFELNKTQIDAINEKLKIKLKKEPISKVIIDPGLIGGIKLEYESMILDNSIESKIRHIKQTMKRGN